MNLRAALVVVFLFFFGLTSNLHSNVVTEWNEAALSAIRQSNTSPPAASRNLAILHVSIFDAVNGIARTYDRYHATGQVSSSASKEAAAATAAHVVLTSLYPSLDAEFDQLYDQQLSAIADGPQKTAGINWGNSVADQILELRSDDGSADTVVYTPGTLPGEWRPTISFGGIVRPALLPQWGFVDPFGIENVRAYLPPRPPRLNTLQYALEVNLVKAIGGTVSSRRTSEQTEIARFWGYGPGSSTPPGHWNQIALVVSESKDLDLEENARLFALLNIALADAAIISWDCKYVYNYWRPITAIQEADTDGNPRTVKDATWTPLLETPPFPEYTSGHSTFSGAAAAALARFFDSDSVQFSVGSDDLPGVTRNYRRFSEAALESGNSRIYGGIHFPSANVFGLGSGWAAGNEISSNLLRPRRAGGH
jgi:hypothetical protein